MTSKTASCIGSNPKQPDRSGAATDGNRLCVDRRRRCRSRHARGGLRSDAFDQDRLAALAAALPRGGLADAAVAHRSRRRPIRARVHRGAVRRGVQGGRQSPPGVDRARAREHRRHRVVPDRRRGASRPRWCFRGLTGEFERRCYSLRMVRPAIGWMFAVTLLWSLQAAAQGVDVRLVIDVSGSMKSGDPEYLRQDVLNDLVEMLPPGSRAGVWTFGSKANMVVAARRDRRRVAPVGPRGAVEHRLGRAAHESWRCAGKSRVGRGRRFERLGPAHRAGERRSRRPRGRSRRERRTTSFDSERPAAAFARGEHPARLSGALDQRRSGLSETAGGGDGRLRGTRRYGRGRQGLSESCRGRLRRIHRCRRKARSSCRKAPPR